MNRIWMWTGRKCRLKWYFYSYRDILCMFLEDNLQRMILAAFYFISREAQGSLHLNLSLMLVCDRNQIPAALRALKHTRFTSNLISLCTWNYRFALQVASADQSSFSFHASVESHSLISSPTSGLPTKTIIMSPLMAVKTQSIWVKLRSLALLYS